MTLFKMSKVSPVFCVSILAPDNSPIFLEKYIEDENLELDTAIFESLSFTGKRSTFRTPSATNEKFVGCISKTPKYQAWGYQASLHYKLVIITNGKHNLAESSMKQCFEAVSDALLGAIRNPFYSPFSQISAEDFSKKIRSCCEVIRVLPQPASV